MREIFIVYSKQPARGEERVQKDKHVDLQWRPVDDFFLPSSKLELTL